jgi:SH3-like domain-containing protein
MRKVCFTKNHSFLNPGIMVLTRLKQFVRGGAIAALVVMSSIACQSPSDTAPPSDEPASSSAADSKPESTPDSSASTPTDTAPASPADETQEPVAASPPAAVPQQTCSVSAYVADTDPAGLNVRSGPGSDFEAIATLPTNEPIEVSIVGTTDGWFLINEAYSQERQELNQPGWVYGPLLGVSTTSLDINDPEAPATLYEAPDGFSSVKAEVPKFTEVTLLSCSGNWLQVQTGETTGWLSVGEQCSDPTAPCP